ncbi:hypothetical protein JXM67_12665 [candidate division WOR-3 bacterium]|nr:hypothetical protein [candidate division WOR-3 bacterium]
MARARGKLADLLSGWSRMLFNWLTRHEEHSVLVSRIKMPLLGIFVALISWLSIGCPIVGCYVPIDSTPVIRNTSVTPNPTSGSDSVTISTSINMYNPPDDCYITRVVCVINKDSTDMEPLGEPDHNYGDGLDGEPYSISLYVGDIEPGTVELFINACNTLDEWGRDDIVNLEVTEE